MLCSGSPGPTSVVSTLSLVRRGCLKTQSQFFIMEIEENNPSSRKITLEALTKTANAAFILRAHMSSVRKNILFDNASCLVAHPPPKSERDNRLLIRPNSH